MKPKDFNEAFVLVDHVIEKTGFTFFLEQWKSGHGDINWTAGVGKKGEKGIAQTASNPIDAIWGMYLVYLKTL